MKYLVCYDPKSEKYLEKLPKPLAARIVKKMREVGETGRGIELLKDEQYGYKIRVGDYRILIDLTYNPHIIWVRHIDHRGRVYERL
jgi:mRNA interferase RelE/StbE